MEDSCQEGPSLLGGGLNPSPSPRVVEAMGVASEDGQLIDSSLLTEVVETILHFKAPSMRKQYTLWALFTSWCGNRQLDPVTVTARLVQCWRLFRSGFPQG